MKKQTKKKKEVLCISNHPQTFFNQFGNAIPENHSNPENVLQSKYYDMMNSNK